MSLNRRRKRVIYLEAAVPETLPPKDETGERVVRAMAICMASNCWRGKDKDFEGILGLSDEIYDYVFGNHDQADDADLIGAIRGKGK